MMTSFVCLRAGGPLARAGAGWVAGLLLALLPALALGQRPTITTVTPAANAGAVARTSAVTVTFSQALSAGSAAALQVFSAQRGGRRTAAAPATVSGSTLSFAPGALPYQPGEQVQATITTAAGNANLPSQTLLRPRVVQFTAAVDVTSRGTAGVLSATGTVASTPYPEIRGTAVGDVDGDGDLDLVFTSISHNYAHVRLNGGNALGTNTGSFSNGSDVNIGTGTRGVALGDVDGDGDLDLLVSSQYGNYVGVRLNGGSATVVNAGTFSGGSDYLVSTPGANSSPRYMAMGDMDGDGDLDLVTANLQEDRVQVLLNRSNTGQVGQFATGSSTVVGSQPISVKLGDVDGDGDLDAVVANYDGGTTSVLLNGGDATGSNTGVLSVSQTLAATGDFTFDTALGDVDGDGDLDLLVVAQTSGWLKVFLNAGGTSRFVAQQTLTAIAEPTSVVLADMDGDRDLDAVMAYNSGIAVSLNAGGTFARPVFTTGNFGSDAYNASVADFNGDGVLDAVAGNNTSNSVRVYLGLPAPPTITGVSPGSGAAGSSITVTGTNLAAATGLTVNGVAATITGRLPTSLTATVPAGASPTASITVTAAGGTSAAYTAFQVLLTAGASGTAPARHNLTAALPNSALTLGFTEAVTAASAANIRVFSAQAGGLKAGTVTPGGAQVAYASTLPAPLRDFRPGELVSVSVPATVLSTGGLAATPYVYQFTTATAAANGRFADKTDFATAPSPTGLALGDVNGDGLLDLVAPTDGTARTAGVSVLLGTGTGSFGARTDFVVGRNPAGVVLGDVNGDGRLDIVAANSSSSGTAGAAGISVLLGTGTAALFGAKTDFDTGSSPLGAALGDVNGDGLLDLVTANSSAGSVSVLLGTGTSTLFGAKTDFATGAYPLGVTLGDVNGDGRLDVVTANSGSDNVSVLLGTGTGSFGTRTDFAVGSTPRCVALGDLNGDGRLDLVAANSGSSGPAGVSVLPGTGTAALFGARVDFDTAYGPRSVALGDVNGDGRLDLATANYYSYGPAGTSVLPGTGTAALFGARTDFDTAFGPIGVALGDLNGDGRLDLATANFGSASGNAGASVLLGLPPAPALSALSPAAELPGQVVVLTGTGFSSGSAVSFGGVAAGSVSYTSPTSLTAVVPAGAAPGSSAVVVTTVSGSSPSSPAFEVLQVYRSTSASGCLSTEPLTLSGSGGAGTWRYLRLPAAQGGAVVAAIEDTRNLGTVAAGFSALGTATGTAVRQDGSASRAYLDRNFYLTATNPAFPGQAVRVRFFGLSSELSRLMAVDANATAANLKASQYSGPNEDCTLSNNDPNADHRLLAAPATAVAGTDWFTAQVSVADHFSEFYLTGASAPLPVELTGFTAAAEGRAVRLRWATASEKNSARFEVERSHDGKEFQKIGQQQAQGTTASPTSYTYLDSNAPPTHQPIYYRLRQLDLNGTATYSPVRAVTRAIPPIHQLTIAPNPAHSAVAVSGVPAGNSVEVFDALGRAVARATADASGTVQLALPPGLAAGVYVLRSGKLAQRLVVE